MRNSKISRQKFKALSLMSGIAALLVTTTSRPSAAISIKDTNYPIPSGAYFVSPNGQESNSGRSANSPWPVAKAIASAPRGSTIVFRRGTYRNVSRISIGKKLTLQAYPHEKAWLKGSVVVTGWVAEGKIWRKDNWKHSFPQRVSRTFINPDYPMAGYRDMVYVNGVSLRQVASKNKVVPGTFYVNPRSRRLYIGNNPAGKTVESTAKRSAFSFGKNRWHDSSGSVIRGLGFAHYADQGVSVGTANVKIENNTFIWNGIQGLAFWGESHGVKGVSTDAIVRGNTFSYNGRRGLGGSRVHRMLLEDNVISYNNFERFVKHWDAAGVKIADTDGVVWRRNLVKHNFSIGMWVDVSSTNATIVQNISHDNNAMGIFFELSHKAIIAGNIAYNNTGTGIMVSNSSSARVYNNTLVNNGSSNFVIKDTNRNNNNAQQKASGITWVSRNHVFKNNILSNTTGARLLNLSNCSTLETSSSTISDVDYNAYYRRSDNDPKNVISWSLGRSGCSVGYSSIAAFKSATRLEEHSLAIDNVATNPFFVDERNKNFNLKSGSPAIGRGAPLPSDVARALGLPAGRKVDIGALQSKTVLVNQ